MIEDYFITWSKIPTFSLETGDKGVSPLIFTLQEHESKVPKKEDIFLSHQADIDTPTFKTNVHISMKGERIIYL
jgi:hypothetical protein